MINSDLAIGLVTGSIYGYLFRPVFQFFFKNSALIFKRSILPSFLVAIFIGLIPSIGVAGFLLTALILKPIVIFWKTFVFGYGICFFIGMVVYAAFHKKQLNRWD